MKKTIKLLFVFVFMITFLPTLNAAQKVSLNELRNTLLPNFYKKLVLPEDYLLSKVELIKKSEYDIMEKNSYVFTGLPLYTDTRVDNQIYYIGSDGKLATTTNEDDKIAYSKPVLYVKPETKVRGYGTRTKPYKFISNNDIVISKLYINNIEATELPTEGTYDLSQKCTGGSVSWNNETHELYINVDIVPVECMIWLTEK